MYGLTLGTYNGTEVGSYQLSKEGTIYVILEGLLLGYWLVSLDVLGIGKRIGN